MTAVARQVAPSALCCFAADGCTHAQPQIRTCARTQGTHGHTDTRTHARAHIQAISRVRRSSSVSAQRCSTSGGTSSPTATSAPEGPTPATVAHASARSTRAPVGTARLHRQPSLTAVQVPFNSRLNGPVPRRQSRAHFCQWDQPAHRCKSARRIQLAECTLFGRAARHHDARPRVPRRRRRRLLSRAIARRCPRRPRARRLGLGGARLTR